MGGLPLKLPSPSQALPLSPCGALPGPQIYGIYSPPGWLVYKFAPLPAAGAARPIRKVQNPAPRARRRPPNALAAAGRAPAALNGSRR